MLYFNWMQKSWVFEDSMVDQKINKIDINIRLSDTMEATDLIIRQKGIRKEMPMRNYANERRMSQ
jgi:hypothetical protein